MVGLELQPGSMGGDTNSTDVRKQGQAGILAGGLLVMRLGLSDSITHAPISSAGKSIDAPCWSNAVQCMKCPGASWHAVSR